MLEECPHCFGDGFEPGEYETLECPTCSGNGILDKVKCDLCMGRGCPRCDDQGFLFDIECPTCDCTGVVEKPLRCTRCKGFKTVVPYEKWEKRDA